MNYNAKTGPWLIPGIEDRLIELHSNGSLGFTAIARMMSEEYDVTLTKNAIAGRVHRLCLPLRNAPKKGSMTLPKSKEPKATFKCENMPVITPPPEPAPDDGLISLIELRDDLCHWPFGEHPKVRYCGQKKYFRSYCWKHFHEGYVVKS